MIIAPNSLANEGKIQSGTQTTVAAVDTIQTALKRVDQVLVSMRSDPTDDPEWCSAVVNANDPSKIDIKTWKNTGGTDPTPAAATTFSKLVDWLVIGV